ncbi:hypothetical protein [uncultured Clostridium sp.]|uniref:hypothetical protein n=1 Tax=uncultured Clostridium sp. TaxID=59620 RepID=UPI002589D70F|nr:hypothetical protein [uncultured Clostridium sp.]
MDIPDYASNVTMKGMYLCANTVLDVLIALLKRFEKHLENLDKNGEKTYLKRGIHKVQSLIKRREINRLNLEISETKFELKQLNKELFKAENEIKYFELQEEKNTIEDKISSSKELIEHIRNSSENLTEDNLNNIKEINNSIEEYEKRLENINDEIIDTGIIKNINKEKYEENKIRKSEIVSKMNNLQEHLNECLEQKDELKEQIEALKSVKLNYEPQDLKIRKKNLQEELDVLNRKMKKDKAEQEANINTEIVQEEKQEDKIIEKIKEEKIKDTLEDNKAKIEEKESTQIEEKESEKNIKNIDNTVKKVIKIATIEEGLSEIKNAYRDMKLMAIDNPKLLKDEKYNEKLKKAEELMKKYDLVKDKTKEINKSKVELSR